LERVEAARTAAEHERERLAAQVAEKAVFEEEVQSLRLELHRARERHEQAQEQANRLLERAQALLPQVEESRAKFAETEQKHLDQIRSLETVIAQQTPAGAACDPEEQTAAWQALREGQAARIEELEAQLAAAKTEARQAARSRDEVIEKLDQRTAAHASLEIEMEGIREQTDERLREMEALRHEAAAQVAAANAQAGDIEREYARVRAAVDWSRQTSHVVVAGLRSLHQQLAEMAQEVGQLTERLIKLAEADRAAMDERPTYQPPSRALDPEAPEAMSLEEPVGFQPSSSES
jgi:chromosome segregation ATPase